MKNAHRCLHLGYLHKVRSSQFESSIREMLGSATPFLPLFISPVVREASRF